MNNSIITAGYVKIDSVYGIVFQRNSLSGDLIWRRIYFPSIVKTSLPIAPINIASLNNGITYFAGLSVSGSIDQNGTLQSLFVTEPFFFTNVQIVDTNRLLWSGIYANADTVDLVYVYTDYQFNVLYGYQLGTKGHDGGASLITNDLSFRNSYVVESIVFDTTLVLVAPTKGISFDTSDLEATLVIRVSNDSMGNVSSAYVFYGYSDFPTSFVPSKILLGFNSEIMIHGTVKLPDSNEVEAALLTLNYKDFSHQHYRRVGLWHHSIGLPILTFDSDGYLFNSFFSTEKYFYGNYINDIYYHCDNCQSSEIINILIRGHAIDDSVYIKPVLKPVFTVQDTPLMANTIVAATKFQSTLEMDCMIIDNVATPKEPYPVYFVTHNLLYLGEEIIELKIYDLTGRKIFHKIIDSEYINLSLPSGIYIAKGITKDGSLITKLLTVK